ncbi:MAG: universal stress protein [Burkholderiales bacterium]|nr:universal stress protein [Bacteroidia bacterium]
MKSILVPLDFSETSDNALQYAIHLAKYLSADIILFHVISTAVFTNENDVLAYSMHDSMETSKEVLIEKAGKLKQEHVFEGIIKTFVEAGDFKTVFYDYMATYSIDLVVMGITEHSTKIGQLVFGSNAVSVSRESNVPVFIVPKTCTYSKINNIAYASEYDVHVTEQTGLIQIKYIVSLFDASLSVLHVIPDNHLINELESMTDFYVEQKLEMTNHKTYILSEKKVSVALLDFIKNHDIDIIVLEQKKHSFLHDLIYPSITKDVAFSSPIPILTIHS